MQFCGPLEGKEAFCGEVDIRNFLQGYKRRWAHKGCAKRLPITTGMLTRLLEQIPVSVPRESRGEVGLAYLLGYMGLLRCSEVYHLRWEDICVRVTLVFIFVRKSKTDPLKQGQLVQLESHQLPSQVRDWFARFEHVEGPVFKRSSPVLWRAVIQAVYSSPELAFHSLRHDEASEMWRVGDQIEKNIEMGRWKSKSACMGYLHW